MSADEVVVIGSGPCGAMATKELVDRGVRVTMLDAGDRAPRGVIVRVADRTIVRWVEPAGLRTDRHRALVDPATEWYSSLSQGGLSNYWTSAVPRFAPEDFTDGARRDVRYQWPISYDDLLPYYEATEQVLAVTTGNGFNNVPQSNAAYSARLPADWQELCDAATALGHGMNAMPMAKGRPWMFATRGTGFSSYHCIIKPLLRSPNFRLIRSARVRRIHWSAAAGRADGVEFLETTSGEKRTIRADVVFVAAGALDSTQILLRSTSNDFPNGLGNSHDVLGRYLHDHPRQWWPADFSRPLSAMNHPVYISRADYDSSRSLSGTSMTIGLTNARDRLKSMAGGSTKQFGVQVFGTMVPREDSRISLDPNAEPDDLDAPLLIAARYEPAVLEDLDAARSRFRAIFDELGVRAEPRGPFHELHPGSSVHWGGSVRMHRSPEFGMVDEWNRLHDVPNVIVCDASSFTTGPEKNPTITAMAISARAARRVVDQGGR
jgi:choline dehydrogenase-like flavoprotein